ncbi:MAG: hypothetical protein NTV92_01205 [Candidatus Bipolaricaulota bacterium]|nr:hypothetical protein [Candidatus Bipolaricaulota bacterium]
MSGIPNSSRNSAVICSLSKPSVEKLVKLVSVMHPNIVPEQVTSSPLNTAVTGSIVGSVTNVFVNSGESLVDPDAVNEIPLRSAPRYVALSKVNPPPKTTPLMSRT